MVSRGTLDPADPTDLYRFDLESPSNVTLLLGSLSANADLKLQDATGKVLSASSKKKKRNDTIKKFLPPGEYRVVVQWADSEPAAYSLQSSAEFVVDDVVVTGKTLVQDPEYDSATLKAAWREGTTLYATDIDPDTGYFIMGNRVVVDTGLAKAEEVVNGPEWASVNGGQPRVIYTKSDGTTWSISQARELPSGTWDVGGIASSSSTLDSSNPSLFTTIQNWLADRVPDTQDSYTPVGTPEGDDPVPMMKYTIGNKSNRDQGSAWKELDAPYNGGPLPIGAIAGRFIPGRSSIIYTRDIQGFQQLVWYDLQSRQETVLTDSPIHKLLPFAINAPEFGGDIVITAPETDNITERGFFDSFGIYREIDGVWTLIKRISSPSQKLRGVHSVEPFVFDGRTYVSFLVLNAISRETGERKNNAEVWIASLDPEDHLLRKISGSSKIKRSDPESLVTENEVFIYYTEIGKNDSYKQHRVRTGLIKR